MHIMGCMTVSIRHVSILPEAVGRGRGPKSLNFELICAGSKQNKFYLLMTLLSSVGPGTYFLKVPWSSDDF